MNSNLNIFLKCDISGIQSFIFNVPSTGAARELKSRSIYVGQIADSCLKELKSFFKDEPVKELYNGGGNFYLEIRTCKNGKDIDNKILEIQNLYLKGDIFPYISYINKRDSLINSLNDVNLAVQKAKMHRLISFDLLDSTPIKTPNFNIKDIQGINGQVPNGDFSWIAEQSEGDKKLAALKLDVDNLGSLFIGRTDSDYTILSQELKDFFNNGLLQLIKNNKLENNIYIVFSGGDDCFLIGSWNRVLELAIDLRKKFTDFQNDLKKKIQFDSNNDITFSAGIIIFAPHYPMLQMSEEVEEALNTSKRFEYFENGFRKEKDSVTIFGKTLSWKDFEKAQSLAKKFTDLISNCNESKSLLKIFRLVYPQDKELPKVWRLKYFFTRNVQSKNREILKPIFNEYEQALLFRYLNPKFKTLNPDIYLVATRWAELLLKN
jgi:CRISPR/Cas system-associated protein Cas10 (large subunit of type III CRISPR-Cas system)